MKSDFEMDKHFYINNKKHGAHMKYNGDEDGNNLVKSADVYSRWTWHSLDLNQSTESVMKEKNKIKGVYENGLSICTR